MNTPTHAILNLTLLGRKDRPGRTWPVLLGAAIPDLPIYLCFCVEKWGNHLSSAQIWGEAYFSPKWQVWVDAFHSFPLILCALGLAVFLKRPNWIFFTLSMLLHALEDFPVHVEDAHRQFWPLSNWRFISPVSYWDPRHYGNIGAFVEWGLVLVCSVILWKRGITAWAKGIFFLICFLEGFFLIRFF